MMDSSTTNSCAKAAMKVHDKLILKNIIIFQGSYWMGNAYRQSMYSHMERDCGSNSHLTDGSDKLLCLLKKSFSREEFQ